MAYSARILKDSQSPHGVRLTTFEVSFPRIVLAEFNTHRVFSRNSASSRAIPISKMLARVDEDPFLPIWWGKNEKGMQASVELDPEAQKRAREQWLLARDNAVSVVKRMQNEDIDLHKQIANRLLEPFLWHTVIVTATEWPNFFNLRCHPAAMPEIRRIADMMRELYVEHTPQHVGEGFWHLPLVYGDDGLPLYPQDVDDALAIAKEWNLRDPKEGARDILVKVSCGRCARVSYLTHDGRRDLKDDIGLYDRLRTSGHMSPLEHAARPMTQSEIRRYSTNYHPLEQGHGPNDGPQSPPFLGNLRGWVAHRKEFPGEAVFRPV